MIIQATIYQSYGTQVSIVASKVLAYWSIDYNGNAGVEIQLGIGHTIKIDGYMSDFEKKYKAAMKESNA